MFQIQRKLVIPQIIQAQQAVNITPGGQIMDHHFQIIDALVENGYCFQFHQRYTLNTLSGDHINSPTGHLRFQP